MNQRKFYAETREEAFKMANEFIITKNSWDPQCMANIKYHYHSKDVVPHDASDTTYTVVVEWY